MTQRWFRARSTAAVGAAIQSMRVSNDMSQDELADQTHSSRATISRLERGHDVALSQMIAATAALKYELILVPRGARVTVDADDL